MTFVTDDDADKKAGFSTHDMLAYIYAVFHSPEYRRRFEPMLKLDFPRVPTPGNLNLFQNPIRLGSELMALHLMESPKKRQAKQGHSIRQIARQVGIATGTVQTYLKSA